MCVISVPMYNCVKLENKLILVKMMNFRARKEVNEKLIEIQKK